jgi:hypothetical protein
MKIETKSDRNNLFIEWPCIICGELFELDETVELLVIDGRKTDDIVCEHCAADLKAGRTTRLNGHVLETVEHLHWLTIVGHCVANGDDQTRSAARRTR